MSDYTTDAETYVCGDCGIESEALKWIFDWEDTVENTKWYICPHCMTRSSMESITQNND